MNCTMHWGKIESKGSKMLEILLPYILLKWKISRMADWDTANGKWNSWSEMRNESCCGCSTLECKSGSCCSEQGWMVQCHWESGVDYWLSKKGFRCALPINISVRKAWKIGETQKTSIFIRFLKKFYRRGLYVSELLNSFSQNMFYTILKPQYKLKYWFSLYPSI